MKIMATGNEQDLLYSDFGGDADLGDLVEMFVSEIPDRIQSMLQAAEAADWEQLGRVAHQIKGAAGSYGFGGVTPIAADLERACRESGTAEAIRQGLEELVDMCRRMRGGLPT